MKYTIVRRVIILGAIAIAGILGTQSYWLMSSWDLNEQDFDQKARLALYNVAEQLSALNGTALPTRDIVRQRSGNTFVVNTQSEIYSPMLEYLLQQELQKLAINIDFEYAIFDCTTDQMLYGGYCMYTDEKLAVREPEATNFAKEDDFTYYFSVKFPDRNGFILSSMHLVLFLCGVLLVTVAFFTYAIVVILRQRRLATMQKEFINNMTHEFKTPLSTIRIAAGVFQRDEGVQSNDRLSRYANIIYEQYERLNGQVEKVLQIAGVDEQGLKLKLERIELHNHLAPILNSNRLRIEERNGHFFVDLPINSLWVKADPMHLSNIIHSLLDNAIKYSYDKLHVSIRGLVKQDKLELFVEDQGIGIPSEQRDKVFEKFYRIPTGNVHDVKGFGLGLYYVQSVCKAHQWPIKIINTNLPGTTFKIIIPLHKN